jgi:hypothetical protein
VLLLQVISQLDIEKASFSFVWFRVQLGWLDSLSFIYFHPNDVVGIMI